MEEVDRRLAEAGTSAIDWQEVFGGQLQKANATLTSMEDGVTEVPPAAEELRRAARRLPALRCAGNGGKSISTARGPRPA